jgi:serine/threonine-protein kinase RsbW
VSHPPGQQHATFHIANTREDIERAEEGLLEGLKTLNYPDAAVFAVRLSIEEALVNAFKHGHKGLPPDTKIEFSYRLSPDRVQIDIIDQGPGFKPEAVRDPTLDENLEIPNGRGLLLMRAYMESVEYLGRGNHVRMVYVRPAKA